MKDEHQRGGCAVWLLVGGLIAIVSYVPSSGPVLAAAFWLREASGWDGFYSVCFLYYPLLRWGRDTPIDDYIEWWVELFGTVGPG